MNRRPVFAIAIAVILCAAAVHAQQKKVEVFGGYEFLRPDGGPNLNGWDGAVTANLTRAFGVTADFGGSYGSGGSVYTYSVGPKVTGHMGAASPFAHALFGGVRAGGNGGSTTGFGMMFGGGLDLGRGTVAWRAIQADWLITRFSGFTDKKNVRVATGIVLRF